ncbi:MAG TPA: FAD-binding oxidoreductase [Geminicoccus sp.]|jgi:glycine/D-amino acid oxidase-like deaminating enzyme|uniref:NAD(P)/FAD-dependent oxidoreductase n=1 Tax=Geminicoccus sp. TaxID=2024832 RepID=UPI002E341433|nr:FAD-binding oxidoreductase [Geminicoccus sp.]HEX2528361.1 FAD-binding oxidoreductase [Geminicoccus sp.]
MAAPRIVVIGTGIIGASIAWHLTFAGAAVTVVDASEPGGVATPCSFAWINASWGNPEPYYRLRIRSMAEWRRLAEVVPALPLSWTGGLCWDQPVAQLQAYAEEHGRWGYGIRAVAQAEIALLEPNLLDVPTFALHVAEEGAVEPRLAAVALLADAQRRGAKILQRTAVSALQHGNGRIDGVKTTNGMLPADHVVLAAGAGTPALAATADIHLPLQTPPGMLVHSRPHRQLLNGLVMAPGMHMRQTMDGRIVTGADFSGADPGTHPAEAARILFERSKAALRGADDLTLDFHTVGYRPTPSDGFPVIGRPAGRKGLYVAVMHSGVTLAPAVGRFAAEEIVGEREEALLAPYRPSRFAGSASAELAKTT